MENTFGNMMKLLMPSEYYAGNTYVKDIVDELKNFIDVTTEVDTFWNTNEKFDIVHIQWAEELFYWTKISEADLSKFKTRIQEFKKQNVALVTTLHNFYPRSTKGDIGKKLYDFLYNQSDVIINLGETSCSIFPDIRNETIYHHNYNKHIQYQPNIDEDVIFSFGKIRSLAELKLVANSFLKLKNNNFKIIISNAKNPYRKLHLHKWLIYQIFSKFYFKRKKNIEIIFRKLSQSEMDNCFNRAKVVFIPRFNSLNSGAVFMALSYGKVVIGPNIGNIEGLLKKLGNPIYEPQNIHSAVEALKEGIKKSREKLGSKNKKFSDENLSCQVIAKKHFEVYKTIFK